MKIWQKFKHLSRARQIAIVVFSLHFLMVFALCTHHLIGRKKTTPSKITVRTIRPAVTQPVSKTKNLPRQSSKIISKKPKIEKISPKKPVSKVKKQTPKLSPNTDNLLEEITNDLEILNHPTKTLSRTSLPLPASLSKSIQLENDAPDHVYGESLAAYLQSVLELPEYGEVKAQLEIDATGYLVHFEILEAHSQKNRKFLEKRLPELTFPSVKSNDKISFTIIFKNLESR